MLISHIHNIQIEIITKPAENLAFYHSVVKLYSHLSFIPGLHPGQQENVMSQRPKSQGLALRQRAVQRPHLYVKMGRVYAHKRETLDSATLTGYSWTIKDVSGNEKGWEQALIWFTSPSLS